MKKTILLILTISIFSSCNQSTPESKDTGMKDNKPKTDLGLQMESARELNSQNDKRNEEVSKQASDLFDEE